MVENSEEFTDRERNPRGAERYKGGCKLESLKRGDCEDIVSEIRFSAKKSARNVLPEETSI